MRTALILAGLTMLAACSGRGGGDEAPAPQAQAAPVRGKTVVDEQLKALEKARAVEKQLQDEKAKRDRELEDAGG
ncbi:MAG: hypothetical protein J0H15_05315 [Xanthomonadales bacterium]|nr:hypothetical protein [Xanthomonadales bacterium]